jgi:hypothetical protein
MMRRIQSDWNSPSRGSQFVQVDSPRRITEMPASFMRAMSCSSRSYGMYSW